MTWWTGLICLLRFVDRFWFVWRNIALRLSILWAWRVRNFMLWGRSILRFRCVIWGRVILV